MKPKRVPVSDRCLNPRWQSGDGEKRWDRVWPGANLSAQAIREDAPRGSAAPGPWWPLVVATLAVQVAHGIGIDPYDPLVLPDAVKRSIVRVEGSHLEAGLGGPLLESIDGTGTIIGVHQDANGSGGWLCILTADHVAGYHTDPAYTSPEWRVGFGSGPVGSWDIVASSATARVFRGPIAAGGDRVDLAVLAVRYGDVSQFSPVALAPAALGGPVIQAGYGDQATLNALDFRYDIQPGYGSFRAGPNTLDARGPLAVPSVINGVSYNFIGLQSDLDIRGTGSIPPFVGEAHLLNGDSGGPTLAGTAGGGFALMGVHQSSQAWMADGVTPGYETVVPGSLGIDVDAWEYRAFIANACAAVPEPRQTACVTLGLLGGFALLRRRFRFTASGFSRR